MLRAVDTYLFNVTRTAVGWAVLGCQRGYGGCDVDGIESTSAGGWRLRFRRNRLSGLRHRAGPAIIMHAF